MVIYFLGEPLKNNDLSYFGSLYKFNIITQEDRRAMLPGKRFHEAGNLFFSYFWTVLFY